MLICLYNSYSFHIAYAFVLLRFFISEAMLDVAIILLTFLIIGVTAFIVFYLGRRAFRSGQKKKVHKYFREIISEIAVCESEEEVEALLKETSAKKIFHRLMKSSFNKKYFLQELIKVSKNMAGSASINIRWVYTYFELEKYSEKNLKSGQWHVKAKAIQDLAQMGQKKYVKNFYRLANHSNPFVRQEAQTAIVKLFGFSGLRFLNVLTHNLSDWQQFCLLHELTVKHTTNFAGIEKWIRSANSSVVIFSLRLIETYHWYELHDAVVALLHHPKKNVQQKAIETLGEIYQANTAEYLINAFYTNNRGLQFSILNVFQKSATQNEIPFLLHLLKHPDNQFKLMAARAIHNCNKNNNSILKESIINNGYSSAALLSQLLEEEII